MGVLLQQDPTDSDDDQFKSNCGICDKAGHYFLNCPEYKPPPAINYAELWTPVRVRVLVDGEGCTDAFKTN